MDSERVLVWGLLIALVLLIVTIVVLAILEDRSTSELIESSNNLPSCDSYANVTVIGSLDGMSCPELESVLANGDFGWETRFYEYPENFSMSENNCTGKSIRHSKKLRHSDYMMEYSERCI